MELNNHSTFYPIKASTGTYTYNVAAYNKFIEWIRDNNITG